MNVLKLQIINLVWLLISAGPTKAQTEFRFKNFTKADGLLDEYTQDVVQDGLGFMWFNHGTSLNRFDGYSFKNYSHNPDDSVMSLGQAILGALHIDPNGELWINNANQYGKSGGLLKYDRKQDRFNRYDPETKYILSINFDIRDTSIWFGGNGPRQGLFNFDPKSRKTKFYRNTELDSISRETANRIWSIHDMGSYLLLGTEKGLWRFEKAEKQFIRPKCNPRDSAIFYSQRVSVGLLRGKCGDCSSWYLINHRIFVKVDSTFSIVQQFVLPEKAAISAWGRDRNGIFWIGTVEGVFRYDPSSASLISIKNIPNDLNSLSENYIHQLTVDRDQNVWVVTDGGISKLQSSSIHFFNTRLPKVNGVVNLGGDRKDELLIYNADGKLWTSQARLGELDIKPFSFIGQNDLNSAFMHSVKGKNNLWIAAWPGGVIGLPISRGSGELKKQPVKYLTSDPKNQNTLNNINVYTVSEDSHENLWVGTNRGLDKVTRKIPFGHEGAVRHWKKDPDDLNSLSFDFVRSIVHENDDSIWIATDIAVDLFHPQTKDGQFEHVFKNRERVSSFLKASDGKLYIGTLGGLYSVARKEGSFVFNKSPLIKEQCVEGKIGEDEIHRLWIPVRSGLVCYNPGDNTALRFTIDDGLVSAPSGSMTTTSSGLMIYSAFNGLSVFNPLSLQIDSARTLPVLTEIKVNNISPPVEQRKKNNEFALQSEASTLEELVLDYLHNNFSLEFSSMEMTAPEKNLYRHKLEGFDPDWIETDYKNRTATYTNLPAGTYTFRVRANNHHGVWSDQERTLKVITLPPPWRTLWAYAGYGLLAFGLLLLARRNIVQRERLRSNLRLAKVEQEKEHFELEKAKEVDRVKTSFFTNISHEFRTPLTLIKGPVQKLLEEFEDNPKVRERLKMVQRNSDLLLKLINQLLDLAKLETGTLKVEKSEGELNSFIGAVTNSFSSFAAQKNIALTTDLPPSRTIALFDKDKLETILINLINNAIKFTLSNGTVEVIVETAVGQHPIPIAIGTNDQHLILRVKDNGIGIPLDQQSKIFEPFHQVSEAHKEVGTGIGLSLVKELVALMGGTIHVKSEPGKGSEFTVRVPIELVSVSIPKTASDFKIREQMVSTVSAVPTANPPSRSASDGRGSQWPKANNSTLNEEADADKPHVLIVEDNADLRSFIIDSLGDEFHYLEAENGKAGLHIATREIPDLIISDVMMPEMDGMEMTQMVKSDIRTSHIPLILLTAKSTEESMLSGLQSGADDYMTKPFNRNELLLKVRNGVSRQQKLREKLRAELMREGPRVEVMSADEQFLNNVKEKILERLSDEQLSVESLAEDIGMSRVQLYRKVSGLTGIAVNELIRKLRLQRAAQLLEQQWGPVSQVAYEVGFSNLSYFSKVFKEEFGVLPSEHQTEKS